jgi:NAD(P)H-dependent flavin oxidoreductase YrpB (nitropropane dioxygenase family)
MSSALHTDLCVEVGATYPIFGFTHSIDAAIAISRHGGIGIWGSTRSTPEEIEAGLSLMDDDAWAAADAPAPLKMPYQDILVGDVLGQIERHRVVPLMHSPAGQSIASFDRLTTVADVMRDLVEEATATLTRLTNR